MVKCARTLIFLLLASWNFAHSSTVFRSLNELVPLMSSVEVAGSSTLPAHKNMYELEHRNCVIKMFFQLQIVTHYHRCQHGVRK